MLIERGEGGCWLSGTSRRNRLDLIDVEHAQVREPSVETPKTVLSVANEGQPGWAIGIRITWMIVLRQYATHDIFVDVEAKGI